MRSWGQQYPSSFPPTPIIDTPGASHSAPRPQAQAPNAAGEEALISTGGDYVWLVPFHHDPLGKWEPTLAIIWPRIWRVRRSTLEAWGVCLVCLPRTGCDGSFHVSTWLAMGARYVVKHYWGCFCGGSFFRAY